MDDGKRDFPLELYSPVGVLNYEQSFAFEIKLLSRS